MNTQITPQNAVPPVEAKKFVRIDPVCDHEVQFYFNDSYLLDSVAFFFEGALRRTGSAIVVATEAHRAGIQKRLEACGIPLSTAIQQGRFIALDAQQTLDTFMRGGQPDPVLFREVVGKVVAGANLACKDKSGEVAIFGEMVSLLCEQGNIGAALELERRWNELAGTHRFCLRCGYPIVKFNRGEHEEAFAQICQEHSTVIPAESYTKLVDDNARLTNVARLQQIEQARKTEAAGRALAEAKTQQVQDQNRHLQSEIKKRDAVEEELRLFARRLLMVRDEEQHHIASELHENMAQLIATLSMYFGVLQEERGKLSPRASEAVMRSRIVAQDLLRGVRKLSNLLHPLTLDNIGLRPALREFIQQFVRSGKAAVVLEMADDFGRLPRRMEIGIFRMIEEALNNLSDSRKGSCKVRLARSESEVRLEIESRSSATRNEGAPLTVGKGVVGIAERAKELGGSLHIRTDSRGTLFSITLPVQRAAAA